MSYWRGLVSCAAMLVSATAAEARQYDAYLDWLTALSIGYQGCPALGVGLATAGAYERTDGSFIDATLSVALLFAAPTVIEPTLTADTALLALWPGWVYLDIGGSLSIPTDLKRTALMTGPRMGLASEFGILRLVYTRQYAIAGKRFAPQDEDRVMLELNITSLYHMRIGL